MNIRTPLFIIGGIALFYYLQTARALMTMQFSIAGVKFRELSDSTLVGDLVLRADNSTSTNIRFQRLRADLFIDHEKIGEIDNAYDFNIPPKSHAHFAMQMRLSYKQAGRLLWNAIQSENTDVALRVKGHVVANSKTYPLNIEKTAQQIATEKK